MSGYACKGNQPTGAVVDLFNDLVNSADEFTGATAKSICTKLLMQTVKRVYLISYQESLKRFYIFDSH